jgi:N-acetylglutamate synthase/N-acetylornithine aminotransferase
MSVTAPLGFRAATTWTTDLTADYVQEISAYST